MVTSISIVKGYGKEAMGEAQQLPRPAVADVRCLGGVPQAAGSLVVDDDDAARVSW